MVILLLYMNLIIDLFQGDDVAIAQDIRDHLQKCGFKVCYHLYDFYPGKPILWNMERAITKSKRTLCLLTDNFLVSAYCMYEFTVALQLNVQLRKHRLIILKWSADINMDPNIETYHDMRQFIHTHTYIDRQASNYMDQ